MKKTYIILGVLVILIAYKANIIKFISIEDSTLRDSEDGVKVNEINEKSIEVHNENNTVQFNDSLSKRLNYYIENQLDSKYTFDAELYRLYSQVLLSEKTFSLDLEIEEESKKEYYLNNIFCYEIKLMPKHFSFIDMDNDNVPEVVIEGDEIGGFVFVLRKYDGRIIGHKFSFRQMNNIKKDGSYCASGGAAYNGYYQLSFKDDSYLQYAIVRMDTEEDSKGELMAIYLIDEKKVEKEAFWEFWKVQENKEEPIWVEFELNKKDE
ncbi:hypothetical protein PV797_10285 [Clostridiaceae bacterium M8S5]|nr:hypothetical protein PV797_10285 [Clostridiaceae bacterium M8S5]